MGYSTGQAPSGTDFRALQSPVGLTPTLCQTTWNSGGDSDCETAETSHSGNGNNETNEPPLNSCHPFPPASFALETESGTPVLNFEPIDKGDSQRQAPQVTEHRDAIGVRTRGRRLRNNSSLSTSSSRSKRTSSSRLSGGEETPTGAPTSACRSWSRSLRRFFGRDQTLILFDWDDTLFPTTWLSQQGYLRLTNSTSEILRPKMPRSLLDAQLEPFVDEVRQTLLLSQTYGTVVIITNGTTGWVNQSCQNFMSSIQPQVSALRSVSAKTQYQGVDEQPEVWKTKAFQNEVQRYASQMGFSGSTVSSAAPSLEGTVDQWLNVISIGDSAHERTALLKLSYQRPSDYMKSLQLLRAPDVRTLTAQHQTVRECLSLFVDHDSRWTDLKFVKT